MLHVYIYQLLQIVTLLRRLSDPGKGLSDLELMVEKTTLKNQDHGIYIYMIVPNHQPEYHGIYMM